MTTDQRPAWPTETDIERMRSITLDGVRKHQRRIRRNRIIGTSAAATIVLGSAAAAIYLPPAPHAVASLTYCYSEQSLDSGSVQAAGAEGTTNPEPAGGKAMEACGLNWAHGELPAVKGIHSAASQNAELPIPPLGACFRPDNAVAVFPLTTTSGQVLSPKELCQNLNLRPAN